MPVTSGGYGMRGVQGACRAWWPDPCSDPPFDNAQLEVTDVNLSIRSILLLVAVVIFVLAAFGVSLGAVNLVPLGLAFFAGAFLVDEGGFGRLRP
jgi:hypothetical protein